MTHIRFAAAAAAILLALSVPGLAQTADPYKGMNCDDMLAKAMSMNNRMEMSDKRNAALSEIGQAKLAQHAGRNAECKAHARTAMMGMM